MGFGVPQVSVVPSRSIVKLSASLQLPVRSRWLVRVIRRAFTGDSRAFSVDSVLAVSWKSLYAVLFRSWLSEIVLLAPFLLFWLVFTHFHFLLLPFSTQFHSKHHDPTMKETESHKATACSFCPTNHPYLNGCMGIIANIGMSWMAAQFKRCLLFANTFLSSSITALKSFWASTKTSKKMLSACSMPTWQSLMYPKVLTP